MFKFLPLVNKAFKDGERCGFETGFRIGLRLGRELEKGNTVIIGDRESIKKMLNREDKATVEEINRIFRER